MIRALSCWSKLPCSQCGIEEYATRTEPKAIDDEKFLCNKCDVYERAYQKGFSDALSDMLKAVQQLGK